MLEELFEGKVAFMKQQVEKAIAYRASITTKDEKEASSMVEIENRKAKVLPTETSEISVEMEGPLVLKEGKSTVAGGFFT